MDISVFRLLNGKSWKHEALNKLRFSQMDLGMIVPFGRLSYIANHW